MLELLLKYAESHDIISEPGFKAKDVRWALAFSDTGEFVDLVELGDTSNKKNRGQTFPQCPDLSQPELVGGGAPKSHFLADAAQIVVLYDNKDPDGRIRSFDKKLESKHSFFTQALRDASSVMPELKIFADALEQSIVLNEVCRKLKAYKAKPTDKITIMLGTELPLESAQWHDWWREFRKTLACGKDPGRQGKHTKGEASDQVRCFATGRLIEPADTHPKIEGLTDVGGLAAGDLLISFDKESFSSYGLHKSANAAVSHESSAGYRGVLNLLIKESSRRLAGAKVVHWFSKKTKVQEDPMAWLIEPPEQQEAAAQDRAHALLRAVHSGHRPDLADNHFYVLTLSGVSGRVMVRDWMEGSFDELVRHVSQWFEDFSIVARNGSSLAPNPKFMAALGSMVRDLDELHGPLEARLWRTAVKGEAFPQAAQAHALIRLRSSVMRGESMSHAGIGLLKAYHIRNNRLKGGNPMTEQLQPHLNQQHPSPAYQCGRLMAVLASLQRAALPDVDAGVVQRYFASAGSTPALVLGRITRLSQFHLHKLQPRLAYWYESRIAAIWGQLRDSVPTTLSLEEQSLFALGYYQQLAAIRTKKTDNTDTHEEGSIDHE